MADLKLPPPNTFGLPDKFHEWRTNQDAAVESIVNSTKRFIMMVQPTGSGKSLCYMAASVLNGGRTLILTSTKGLQDQLVDDFGNMSTKVEAIKGKNAYKCPVSHVTANYGPCLLGKPCMLKAKGCPYYDQLRRAKAADIVITNYAFWLSNEPDVLGKFDMLVLDEAHASVQHLLDGMGVHISKKESDMFLPWVAKDNPDDCLKWGLDLCDMVDERVKGLHLVSGELVYEDERSVIDFLKKVRQLKTMRRDNMAVDRSDKTVAFDPIWPAGMGEPYLFRGIDKVVLTSATVTMKTAELLGMDQGEVAYDEYPSTFPLHRRPVYYIPTVRVDHRIDNVGYKLWVTRIDQIIRSRFQHKGVIHTVSYDRKNRVMNSSEHSDIMVTHDSRNTLKVVERFKEMDPPAVLLSPSMVTGWDFPYEQCRWQIVGKVPFPDSRSKVMKARGDKDPTYAYYLTMQALVQAAGRGMRAEDDYCETIIIDDHFQWFNYKYRQFAPQAFREAVQMVRTIPEPINK